MKKCLSGILVAVSLSFAGIAGADGIANVYTCELNEDSEIEDVQAANKKWLDWVNAHIEGGGITSSVGTAVVGNQEVFIFMDMYPSLASWAATADALNSDTGDELEDLFDDTSECSKNRLWRMEDTK